MARLSQKFYLRDTVAVAKSLLGTYLVRVYEGEMLVGRITETESYIGRCDKACHAYNYRRTKRTAILFGEPGRAYIYLIYGMYHCLNFVTEAVDEPAAVLIRAVEPVSGVQTIRALRFGAAPQPLNAYQRKNFMNGPGKLCKGFSLSTDLNGADLTGDTLFVCDCLADLDLPSPPDLRREKICQGPRIGVDYAEEARGFPWRFWLETE